MKLSPKQHWDGCRMTITAEPNCDTDTWPFVSEIEFRGYDGTPDYEMGAVASAILFSRYCGTLTEFAGTRLSLDAASAIRCIAPEVKELTPMDGMKRDIGQGVSALVVGEASRMFAGGGRPVGRSARAVTWSGDFVDASERNSDSHVSGDLFTNAALVADSTEISVALALLVGGKAVRDIYVPEPPEGEAASFARIAEGLESVSIKLQSW